MKKISLFILVALTFVSCSKKEITPKLQDILLGKWYIREFKDTPDGLSQSYISYDYGTFTFKNDHMMTWLVYQNGSSAATSHEYEWSYDGGDIIYISQTPYSIITDNGKNQVWEMKPEWGTLTYTLEKE